MGVIVQVDDVIERFRSVDGDALARLHAGLEAAAQHAGLLDVAYRVLDSPVGGLLVAATQRGVVRVAFEAENHERVLDELSRTLSPRILKSPARLDRAAHEFDEYFAGARSAFDLPLDFQLSRGYRKTVLEHLRAIDYGTTASYAHVAVATGNPKAVRAVGSACATNPIPILIPCHRVVRSDGKLGGYLGGLDAKRLLLSLEAA